MTASIMRACCAAAVTAVLCSNAEAVVLGKAVTPTLAGEMGVSSFSFGLPTDFSASVPINTYWIDFGGGGDTFGYAARDGGFDVGSVEDNPAFAIMDDSVSVFTGDTIGIVGETDFDNFFGVADLVNPDTAAPDADMDGFQDTGTEFSEFIATWEFDITGASGGLSVSIDMAAAGDFEAFPDDYYDFEYSFDGVNYNELFRSGILNTNFTVASGLIDMTVAGQSLEELELAQPEVLYTLDNGLVVGLNDPLTMNGTALTNEFQTLSVDIGATESTTLSIRIVANTDSSSEGFAFRNITVEDGGPTPLFGDFNDDGVVNAADYTLWRDGGPLLNEKSNPGVISADDYADWAAAYGTTSGMSAAIPEPTAALLALFALAGLAKRRG